jgi:hypothetical protein
MRALTIFIQALAKGHIHNRNHPRRCPLDPCGNLPHSRDMSKSIRVSDELLDKAKDCGARYHRSPPQQIEYWAKLGRVMESTLSWPALTNAMNWGQAEDIDALLEEVASPTGQRKAIEVIRASSSGLYHADPRHRDRVIKQ